MRHLASRLIAPCGLFALVLGCGSSEGRDAPTLRVSSEAIRGGNSGGGSGGKRTSCSGTPSVTLTPSTLAVGTTIGQGGSYLAFSGSGLCGVDIVFVGVENLPFCYSGNYISNGTFSGLGWPWSGFGAAANESYTFTAAGTYTAGVWQGFSNPDGSYSLGPLLATTTLTVQ
jgi:hypothetical protein